MTKKLLGKERGDACEARRVAILDAARSVFSRSGYADTNVEAVASRAGVAKGTIYLYFSSKEEIFLTALLEDCRGLDAVTRERMEAAECWQEKIRAYVSVRLEYLESHREFLRIYLAEVRSSMLRGAAIGSELGRFARESEGQLTKVFAAAVATKEIRNIDPELAALTLVDLTRGLMERRLLGWCRKDGTCDTEFVLDLLHNALALRSAC